MLKAFFTFLFGGFALAAPAPCPSLSEGFRSELREKLKAGIPFELMAVNSLGEELLCRQNVHVTFDLWDEVLTFKRAGEVIGKSKLSNYENELCKHLYCDPKTKSAYRRRILLNPLWEGRLARLQSGFGAGQNSVVAIDWKKLASELPSEKLMLDQEVKP